MPRPYQKETQQKRRKYIENVAIHGMNKKDAALAAGFSPGMAQNAKARIETPEVRAAIRSLEKSLLDGISTERLVQKLDEGLDATIPKIAVQEGQISEVQLFPDHPTRLKYAEKIALMSGRYRLKNITEHTGKDGGPIELMALTPDELKQRREQLLRELGLVERGNEAGGALPPPASDPETG